MTGVTGTVYDSVAGKPLSGALVQMALGHATGHAYNATSDSTGLYRLEGLPPGRYTATFFHPVLDSLGLQPMTSTVDVRAGAITHRDFAVPSPRTIWTAACHSSSRNDSTALLLGSVRDASTDAPEGGSVVAVMWYQLVISGGKLYSRPQQRATRATESGQYAVCGVPTGISVGVRAQHGAAASGVVQITLPARGILRQDLHVGLADSTVVIAADSAKGIPNETIEQRGTARLVGTVRRTGGQPLHGAQLSILGTTQRAVTDERGSFEITGLAPGTFTLEARFLGFAPKDVAVDLVAHRTRYVAVVMDQPVVALQAVTIYGHPTARDPNGFYERVKSGMGRYFTRQDIERRNPFRLSDMFTAMAGVSVYQVGAFGHRVVMGGGAHGNCVPTVYVDGVRLAMAGEGDIDSILPTYEVAGIEVYRNDLEAPPQYRASSGCGSIVIWTTLALP